MSTIPTIKKRKRTTSTDLIGSISTPSITNSQYMSAVDTSTSSPNVAPSETNQAVVSWDTEEQHIQDDQPAPVQINTVNNSTITRRVKPEYDPTFKTYRTLKCKIALSNHQINLLQTHMQQGSVPNGLYSQIEPNVPEIDADLILEWEDTKSIYHHRLITHLQDFWLRHKAKLQALCDKLNQTLQQKYTEEELTRISQLTNKAEQNVLDKLQAKQTRANTQDNQRGIGSAQTRQTRQIRQPRGQRREYHRNTIQPSTQDSQ